MKIINIFIVLLLFTSCAWLKERFPGETAQPVTEQSKPTKYSEMVRKRIEDNIANVRFCYQKYLDTSKTEIEGSVNVIFFINKYGNVRNISLEKDSIGDKKVKGCVVKAFTNIEFPAHKLKGNFKVNQPFRFKVAKRN